MAQHEKKFLSLNGLIQEIHENRVNAAMTFWGSACLVVAGGLMMALATPLALAFSAILIGGGVAVLAYSSLAWLDSKLSDTSEPGI